MQNIIQTPKLRYTPKQKTPNEYLPVRLKNLMDIPVSSMEDTDDALQIGFDFKNDVTIADSHFDDRLNTLRHSARVASYSKKNNELSKILKKKVVVEQLYYEREKIKNTDEIVSFNELFLTKVRYRKDKKNGKSMLYLFCEQVSIDIKKEKMSERNKVTFVFSTNSAGFSWVSVLKGNKEVAVEPFDIIDAFSMLMRLRYMLDSMYSQRPAMGKNIFWYMAYDFLAPLRQDFEFDEIERYEDEYDMFELSENAGNLECAFLKYIVRYLQPEKYHLNQLSINPLLQHMLFFDFYKVACDCKGRRIFSHDSEGDFIANLSQKTFDIRKTVLDRLEQGDTKGARKAILHDIPFPPKIENYLLSLSIPFPKEKLEILAEFVQKNGVNRTYDILTHENYKSFIQGNILSLETSDIYYLEQSIPLLALLYADSLISPVQSVLYFHELMKLGFSYKHLYFLFSHSEYRGFNGYMEYCLTLAKELSTYQLELQFQQYLDCKNLIEWHDNANLVISIIGTKERINEYTKMGFNLPFFSRFQPTKIGEYIVRPMKSIIEMVDVGYELVNCLGVVGYLQEQGDGQLETLCITHKEQYVACIAVNLRDNPMFYISTNRKTEPQYISSLTQARLKFNKPVHDDETINQVVNKWLKINPNIRVETDDVEII